MLDSSGSRIHSIELARWPAHDLRLVRNIVEKRVQRASLNWHDVLLFLGPLHGEVAFPTSDAMFEIRVVDPPGTTPCVDSVTWNGFFHGSRGRSHMEQVRDASAWVIYDWLGIWPDSTMRLRLSTGASEIPIPTPMRESTYADQHALHQLVAWQTFNTDRMLRSMNSLDVLPVVDVLEPPRQPIRLRSDPENSIRFDSKIVLERSSTWRVDFLLPSVPSVPSAMPSVPSARQKKRPNRVLPPVEPRVEIREVVRPFERTIEGRLVGTGGSFVEALRNAGLVLPESEMREWLAKHALPGDPADISIYQSFGQFVPPLWPNKEFLEWAWAIELPGAEEQAGSRI